MRNFLYGALLLFVMASVVYGGITTITKTSTHPVYSDTTLVRQTGGSVTSMIGNYEANRCYHIEVPCTAQADSFITWGMDISEYQGISVHYWIDTGDSSNDSTVSINFGYQQSPLPASKFVRPTGHSALASLFADSTGEAVVKNITPVAMQYLRFYFYPDTTTGGDAHDIAEDGILHFRVTFLKTPIAQLNAGGVGTFSSLVIPSSSAGSLGPKWFHVYLSDNGDTAIFKWEGGGPNRRTVWENPLHIKDTFRSRALLFISGSMTYGDIKDRTLKADTLVLANTGNEGVVYRINCGEGAVTLSCIDDQMLAGNEGRFLVLSCKNPKDTLVIDHDDGANENIYLAHDDTLFGVADRAGFIQDGNDRWTCIFLRKRAGTKSSSAALFYAADAQGDDDYEVSIPGVTNLWAGLTVTFKANTLNTDGATLEITEMGDLDDILKLKDQALVTGDIEAGQTITVVFDGSDWQMTSQLAQ